TRDSARRVAEQVVQTLPALPASGDRFRSVEPAPTPGVLDVVHQLQVLRVDALPDPAPVFDRQARRDGAVVRLPRDAVGEAHDVLALLVAPSDLAVAVRRGRVPGDPARGLQSTCLDDILLLDDARLDALGG